MGLDQYATLVRKTSKRPPIIEFSQEDVYDDVFFYWRKNRFLHGYMEELFETKCAELGISEPPEFNCVPVQLTIDDINKLEFVVRHGLLEDCQGFFWGHGDYEEADMLRDLEFCKKAKSALEEPDILLYYHAWY